MENINRQVWQVLQQAGLIPSIPAYQQARTEITHLGRESYQHNEKEIGKRNFTACLKSLNRSYVKDDMVRVLGFGRSLTQYCTAGCPVSSQQFEDVSALGALANMIVTLYDQFIDSGTSSKVLSQRDLLLASNTSTRKVVTIFANLMPAKKRILLTLVTYYFKQLESLPYTRQRPELIVFIKKIIYRMYMAEVNTLSFKNKQQRFADRWRKSALPFVIMGLPIWLAMKEFDEKAFLQHIRWLYQIGMLVGYVDDAVDLESDKLNREPNLFISKKQRDLSVIYKRIQVIGTSCNSPWKLKPKEHTSIATREALGCCLVSWYGGVSALEQLD